jgi:hypothetical protein
MPAVRGMLPYAGLALVRVVIVAVMMLLARR